MIKLLLEKGLDPSTHYKDTNGTLFHAIYTNPYSIEHVNEIIDITKLLLNDHRIHAPFLTDDNDCMNRTPLRHICQYGLYEVLMYLINYDKIRY